MSDCDASGTTSESWTFTYDGDGVRVKEVYTDGTGTLTKYYFAGGMYEVQDDGTTQTTKKYYFIAGMRVAMDDGTDLVYFASDHLSSTSIVMDASGTLLSEQRYLPFGGVRGDVGTVITETDFGYTGQRNLGGMGLMDYNARFYSPTLGRFVQPDSIVPNPGDSQAWNRYSYVGNNPVRFVDPSGHWTCKDTDCEFEESPEYALRKKEQQERLQLHKNRQVARFQKKIYCKRNPRKCENEKLRKELREFVAPERVTEDEMKDFNLEKLSPDELSLLDNWVDWSQMTNWTILANWQTSEYFPDEVVWNDPGDAFKHAYWSALLTRGMGENFARDFTTAHETAYTGEPDAREQAFMDLHNNEVGIQIAIANPDASPKELAELVYTALKNGDLVVWDRQNIYYSDTCPECVYP